VSAAERATARRVTAQRTHRPTGSAMYALAVLPEGDGSADGTVRLVVPGSLTLDDLHTHLFASLGPGRD